MSNVGSRIGLILTATASAALIACGESAPATAHDPCTLLTTGEAATYVGLLASPPYRASDGAADARGDQCMYRGEDGRQITVVPEWSGGGTGATGMVQRTVNAIGRAGGGDRDSAHRIAEAEVDGPWDRATWIPGGVLFASQGGNTAQVDVSGASGKEDDAIALAKMIMPRFDHRLSYDGAEAVALAPKPRPHPANACDFISRTDVEAAIGPLAHAPSSDSPEASCTWKVTTAAGERDYAVEFVWQGGQKKYTPLKHQTATVADVIASSSAPIDTMKLPPEMLTGPCDYASLLNGTQLVAVRHDVFVGINLESADYERAKALLIAICSRL